LLVRRKDVLDRIGLVDEYIPGGYAEDYEWLLRATRVGPIACLPEPLVRVHWHDGSYFASRWEMIEQALSYLLEQVPEFEDEPVGLARIEGQLALAHAARRQRRQAWRYARSSLRRSPRSRQAWAALLVMSGAVSGDQVVAAARRVGRGV
jgi:hypothetical protein